MTLDKPSPFFARGDRTQKNSLAIISLSRDQQVPVLLRDLTPDSKDEITNTRFGSYPHSTLLDKPWGSQVVAINVNSRPATKGKKRKREDIKEQGSVDPHDAHHPGYEAASRGFAHILPPTPELWTVSLPHRTQVVYTPDYSYILAKLNARPGDTIIEAGAGSGSFTHASARAVFNGHLPSGDQALTNGHALGNRQRYGKVFSFEYHEPRSKQLEKEIIEHNLQGIVTVTYRDVYEHGFLLDDGRSPEADAIFLDLPEPSKALSHLVRSPPDGLKSPLNPNSATRLCTFSPCIEQVQSTVEAMQRLGWVEISTFEVQHRRLDVRRDLISLSYEGLRGVNPSAANVEEAVAKLRELEAKVAHFHEASKHENNGDGKEGKNRKQQANINLETRKERLERIKEEEKERKVWREGRLVHRTEPELKTHTSYLTFAVLPQTWTLEDEERALQQD